MDEIHSCVFAVLKNTSKGLLVVTMNKEECLSLTTARMRCYRHDHQSLGTGVGVLARLAGLTLLLLLSISTVRAAAAIKVAGEIRVAIYTPTGQEQQSFSARFSLWSAGAQWRIETLDNQTNRMVCGCDGTKICTLLYGADGNTNHSGWITPGSVPLDGSWMISLPWLAFASGNYLETTQDAITTVPGCWGEPRYDAEVWALSKRYFPLEGSGLPSLIYYVVDPAQQAKSVTNGVLMSYLNPQTLREDIYKYPPGFTNAVYKVETSTNLSGIDLPLTFVLERFFPKYNDNGRYLGPATIVRFQGISVVHGIAEATDLLPLVDGITSITDFRFEKKNIGVDYINYNITSPEWPMVDDPKLIAAFKDRVKAAEENVEFFLKRKTAKASVGRGRNLVLIVLVLCFIPLLTYAIRTFFARNPLRTDKHQANTQNQ